MRSLQVSRYAKRIAVSSSSLSPCTIVCHGQSMNDVAQPAAAAHSTSVERPSAPHVSWRVRLAFAFGQVPEGVQSTAFGIFLLYFYNQVLGLSGTFTSIAIVIALIVDAITDPIVGSWSDRTRSRWGRRHPFMYGAALPFALCFYMLFTPPAGLSEVGTFIWLASFAVLTRTTLTLYSIPHTAMTAELSTNYDERTLLSAIRSLFGSIGTLLVMIIGMRGFFRATELYPNGQLNPEAYPWFAATFAVVLVVGIWISALGTHDQIPKMPKASHTTGRFGIGQVIREAAKAFSLRSFRSIVATAILFGMTMGMVTTLSIYLGTLFFEFTPDQLSIMFPMTVLGGFIGAMLATPLSKVISEKKTLLMGGLIWYAMFNTAPIISRLLGIYPENGDPLAFQLVLVCNSICGLGIGVLGVMLGSMVADITDQHEELHGERHEGIYYAALGFAAKAIAGFGTVLSGIIIDIAGIKKNATAASLDPESLRVLGVALGPGILVLVGLTLLAASFYSITRTEHGRMLEVIARRKGTTETSGHEPAA